MVGSQIMSEKTYIADIVDPVSLCLGHKGDPPRVWFFIRPLKVEDRAFYMAWSYDRQTKAFLQYSL